MQKQKEKWDTVFFLNDKLVLKINYNWATYISQVRATSYP